jgi:hypothetical protein
MTSVREDGLTPGDPTTVSAAARPGVLSLAADDLRPTRTIVTPVLLALIPLAVLAVLAALLVMVGNAAAATGGCGGG